MDIQIRRAVTSDIEVLIQFQQRLALETENITLDPDILRSGISALFNDPSKGFYNVAMCGNEVVGCHMTTFEWSDWRNGVVYWLQSVYIKQGFRGQGIFKTMYEAAKKSTMSNDDIKGIRLYVDKSNKSAQSVYAALNMNGDHYQVFEWMKA
jgi:ribosomal protein S18 acetylase RimI-like enzyme